MQNENIIMAPLSQADAPIIDDDALTGHPDYNPELDAYDDAVREVAKLQELGPVVRGVGTTFGHLKFDNIMIAKHYDDKVSYAAVTYDAVRAVYTTPSVFSSSVFAETTGAFWGPGIFMMDPPEHTKYRRHMQLGFTPKLVASWDEGVIRPIIEKHFAKIRGNGKADLVRELTMYFPYEVVGEVVGFDASDITFVAGCFKRIHEANKNPLGAFQAGAEIKAYTQRLIDDRRREPRDDLASAMTRAEVDGNPIPDEIFVSLLTHLMQGGIDTVFRQSSNLLHLLLTHPDQFAKLRANRALIPAAVEEALRFQAPPSMLPRIALQDGEVAGTLIPKGAVIWAINAAANRDPARWPNPHVFDIERAPASHMSFGNGAHSCIGMHLARIELAHFLQHVLDDLPNLRWDPALETIPKITGWMIRGATKLPVVWDVPNRR